MTAADLREIATRIDAQRAEKREYMERTCEAIRAGWTPDVDMRTLGMSEAEADRSALLALVRRVAEMSPEDDEGRSCIFCGACPDRHAADCLWVAARAAFWDEDGYCLTCGGGPDDTGVSMPGKHTADCGARP